MQPWSGTDTDHPATYRNLYVRPAGANTPKVTKDYLYIKQMRICGTVLGVGLPCFIRCGHIPVGWVVDPHNELVGRQVLVVDCCGGYHELVVAPWIRMQTAWPERNLNS